MRIKCPSHANKKRRAFLFALLLVLTGPVVYAQRTVTFTGSEASVARVMREINRQAGITFAFDARTLDSTRMVSLDRRSYDLSEAIDLIISGTDYSYLVKDDYVVINSAPRSKPLPPQQTPRTGDRYVRTNPDDHSGAWIVRPIGQPAQEPIREPARTIEQSPAREYPVPYSAYNNPNLYSQMQHKLPLLAVKTNVLYGATALAPNLSGEIGVTPKTTLEVGGSWNRFNRIGTLDDNKKLNHWIVRPEFRRWFCERYNGHFLGLHAFYSEYNVSQYEIPLLFDKEFRYEGNAFGAGITYGYHLPLGRQWGVEFHVGLGLARFKYDKFDCTLCSDVIESQTKTYFGPTRAGVSLVFLIK